MARKTRTTKRTSRRTSARAASKTSTARMAEALSTGRVAPAETAGLASMFSLAPLRDFFSQRKNIILTLIILVVFVLLYLFKNVFVVALVNGRPIYRWTVIQRLEEQGGKQVLDTLVTEALVKKAINESGVVVNQAEIDAQIQEIEARVAAQGMTLDQALAQESMSREDLIEDIRLQLSAEQLVASQASVTDEMVDAYIAANQEYLPAELTGEALREEVRSQLGLSAVNEAIQQWVQGLRDQAQIQYLKEYSLSL